MLKIIIDGEGRREKTIVNSWKDAGHEFNYRVSEALRDAEKYGGGYNKTYVEIQNNGNTIARLRFDLDNNSNIVTDFRQFIIEDIKSIINWVERDKPTYITNHKEYIKTARNAIKDLQAI